MEGELRVGASSLVAPYVCATIGTFMKYYPEVRIYVEYADSAVLQSSLRSHRIDFALGLSDSFIDENIEVEPCIPVKLYAIMCDTHTLSRSREVTFEDLLKHGIILPDTTDNLSYALKKYLHKDIFKLRIKGTVGNSQECLAIIEDTRSVTLMPRLNIRNHSTLTARSIVGLEQPLMINVSRMFDMPVKCSTERFLKILKDEVCPRLSVLEDAM